ncbi:MAG TPA: hypothetical protein VH560_08605 [Polyangia bacterium]|jgi:hypothetical protein|nr:hypothetical protein [Polyangia bacterium]
MFFRGTIGVAVGAEDPEGLIRQGTDLRKHGDDVRARGYFKRAYELAQTPRSAAQLGLVELALDEFYGSNQHLSEALDSDDPWILSHKGVLEESRRKARAHLAVLAFPNAAIGTRVKVGEHSFVDVPPDGTLWVSPATTTVTVEERGQKPIVTELHVEAGETKTIARVVPPAPNPPAALPPPSETPNEPVVARPSSDADASKVVRPGRSLEIAGIAAGGAGVVGIVAGIVCHHVATTKLDAIRGADAGHTYHDGDLNWQTYDRAGAGLMIGGAVLAVAGVGAFLWAAHESQAVGGARVDSLAISASPGRLFLSGAF